MVGAKTNLEQGSHPLCQLARGSQTLAAAMGSAKRSLCLGVKFSAALGLGLAMALSASAQPAATPAGAAASASREPGTLAAVLAAEPGAPLWVLGSWVNLRAEPARAAKVLANWPVNTPLKLLARQRREADWCQVEALDGSTSGWMACQLLSTKALTLATLDQFGSGGSSTLRAFWLAPSAGRLAAAGGHFNTAALTEAQQERQAISKRPIRFAVPEFEAMKQRLAAGVLPKFEQESGRLQLSGWAGLQQGTAPWPADEALFTNLKALAPLTLLPAVQPSMFRRHAEVLLGNEANVDLLTAMSGQPPKVSYHGVAEWVSGRNDEEGVWSIWDIHEIRARYAQPLVAHAVARNGLVAARKVEGGKVEGVSPVSNCEGGPAPMPDGVPLPGFAQVKDENRLLAFYLPQPLPRPKVEITSRKRQVVAREEPWSTMGEPSPRTVVIHTLDLNQDAVPDVGLIEWTVKGPVSEEPLQFRLEFLNINGQWWSTSLEWIQECT